MNKPKLFFAKFDNQEEIREDAFHLLFYSLIKHFEKKSIFEIELIMKKNDFLKINKNDFSILFCEIDQIPKNDLGNIFYADMSGTLDGDEDERVPKNVFGFIPFRSVIQGHRIISGNLPIVSERIEYFSKEKISSLRFNSICAKDDYFLGMNDLIQTYIELWANYLILQKKNGDC